jgi:cell division protein FtsB
MHPAVSTHDSRRATQVTLRVVALLSAVLTAAFLISFVFSDRGIAELQHSRHRVEDLRADIRRLEADNARLRAEIDSAKRSTYSVERIAREDLGMSKKGEVVYMLPKSR